MIKLAANKWVRAIALGVLLTILLLALLNAADF